MCPGRIELNPLAWRENQHATRPPPHFVKIGLQIILKHIILGVQLYPLVTMCIRHCMKIWSGTVLRGDETTSF